jgi:hypothetical protein
MTAVQFGSNMNLSAIIEDMLLDYGEQLHNAGLSGSTINKRFGMINVLFDEAISWNK